MQVRSRWGWALVLALGGCSDAPQPGLIGTTGPQNADAGEEGTTGASTAGPGEADSGRPQGGPAGPDDTDAGGGGSSSMTTGGSDGGDSSCEQVVVASTRAVPDMLILLDRSGSMDTPVDHTNRWQGSVSAINQVVAELEAEVHFGLMTFPGGEEQQRAPECAQIADVDECRRCSRDGYPDPTCIGNLCFGPDCSDIDRDACEACIAATPFGENACVPAGLDVPVDLFTAQPIAAALEDMFPAGATPTAQSLEQARNVLSMREDTVAGEFTLSKYVMLVTDGDPNCFTTTGGGGSVDVAGQQATIEEVAKLASEGILTYVIGFQTAGTSFAHVLDDAAIAGATGDAMHRSVDSGDALLEEFRKIAGSAVSCSFVLAQDVDETRVEVRIDGELSTYEDDWSLRDDNRTIDLVGEACEALRSGAKVEAEVFCEKVRII